MGLVSGRGHHVHLLKPAIGAERQTPKARQAWFLVVDIVSTSESLRLEQADELHKVGGLGPWPWSSCPSLIPCDWSREMNSTGQAGLEPGHGHHLHLVKPTVTLDSTLERAGRLGPSSWTPYTVLGPLSEDIVPTSENL